MSEKINREIQDVKDKMNATKKGTAQYIALNAMLIELEQKKIALEAEEEDGCAGCCGCD